MRGACSWLEGKTDDYLINALDEDKFLKGYNYYTIDKNPAKENVTHFFDNVKAIFFEKNGRAKPRSTATVNLT